MNGQYLLSLFCLFAMTSCQTLLSDSFSEEMVPESATTMVLTSPFTLPIYTTTAITDVVLVNPSLGFQNIPSWICDLWAWGESESIGVQVSIIPLKMIGSPFAFLFSILFSEQFS